jgi:hypothetical protein
MLLDYQLAFHSHLGVESVHQCVIGVLQCIDLIFPDPGFYVLELSIAKRCRDVLNANARRNLKGQAAEIKEFPVSVIGNAVNGIQAEIVRHRTGFYPTKVKRRYGTGQRRETRRSKEL